MSSLSESINSLNNMSSLGYSPVESSPEPSKIAPTNNNNVVTTFMRCPLPPIWQASPDSLRQYYNNGVVPQTRLFNPNNPTG